MKKTYSTPIIEIEKFDVIDVLTTSAGTGSDTATYGVIQKNSSNTYEVEIVSQW